MSANWDPLYPHLQPNQRPNDLKGLSNKRTMEFSVFILMFSWLLLWPPAHCRCAYTMQYLTTFHLCSLPLNIEIANHILLHRKYATLSTFSFHLWPTPLYHHLWSKDTLKWVSCLCRIRIGYRYLHEIYWYVTDIRKSFWVLRVLKTYILGPCSSSLSYRQSVGIVSVFKNKKDRVFF